MRKNKIYIRDTFFVQGRAGINNPMISSSHPPNKGTGQVRQEEEEEVGAMVEEVDGLKEELLMEFNRSITTPLCLKE